MRFLVAIADGLNTLKDIPALLFRLLLTYGFWGPFMVKVNDPSGFGEFLTSIGVPGGIFWAWVAMICEGLGILFLFFGFATRLITLPLMVIMVVAITMVHWTHGYNPADNGFAIPLGYLLMLFSLFITGPGKISIDGLIAGPYRRRKQHEGE